MRRLLLLPAVIGGALSVFMSGTAVAAITPPSNSTKPMVSGSAVVGNLLATSNGSWTGSPTKYSFQWQQCTVWGIFCANISGATTNRYAVTAVNAGHTLRAVVTATNAAGHASATSLATGVVTTSSLPAGVTLRAIDGGSAYYCSHGFTNACKDGWDSPSFFPIGVWYGSIITPSDVSRWKDLGLNTLFRTTGNTDLSLVRSAGLSAIVDDEGSSGPETPGMGSETVGLLSADEPPTFSAGVTTPLGTVPNAQQDGRFWYLNNTWNFIQYGGLNPISSSAQVLSTPISTPDHTTRHIDIQSIDTYWFSGVAANMGYEGQLLYGLGSSMPASEIKCGCRYGDMVDRERAFQVTQPAPIAQFVENGGPYTEDTSASDYITPPEMNWAVWSSIIHGARQLIYFDHTFAGPSQSGIDFSDSYFQSIQPGQATSIYAQAKSTDALIAQLAPAINSPTALGYVTTDHPATTFGGVETMAKDDNGRFYVFADTRDAETSTNLSTTFTTADHYTGTVTVVGENRSLHAVNGVFTDTFARGSTVHIYQIG